MRREILSGRAVHTRMNRTLLLALFPFPSVLPLAAAGPQAIEPEVARAAFAQAQALADADAGELWGLSLDFPILFVDPQTRALVANRKDAEGELSAENGMWTGRYPEERPIANFSTEWAGVRWTMLIWPPPEDELARARLLMHESFHNAQPELGITGATGACAHLATFEGRLWLRVEGLALAAALEAEADDGSRERAAADALHFRALRRSLFPGSAMAEDGLERVEGSAEYTGVRLCSPDASVHVAAVARDLRSLAERETLTRSFQYATGPALGLLMDGYDPMWREDFLRGRSLTELLSPALQWEAPQELENEALERAQKYGFEQVAAEEAERERMRQERLAGFRSRYLEGPVMILPARSPRTSFDPNRIDLLEDIGSVYGTLWLSDAWGVADAPGGALILSDRRVHLPAPSDVEGPDLAGDGWTLELKPGWRVVAGERVGDYRVVEGERP